MKSKKSKVAVVVVMFLMASIIATVSLSFTAGYFFEQGRQSAGAPRTAETAALMASPEFLSKLEPVDAAIYNKMASNATICEYCAGWPEWKDGKGALVRQYPLVVSHLDSDRRIQYSIVVGTVSFTQDGKAVVTPAMRYYLGSIYGTSVRIDESRNVWRNRGTAEWTREEMSDYNAAMLDEQRRFWSQEAPKFAKF